MFWILYKFTIHTYSRYSTHNILTKYYIGNTILVVFEPMTLISSVLFVTIKFHKMRPFYNECVKKLQKTNFEMEIYYKTLSSNIIFVKTIKRKSYKF